MKKILTAFFVIILFTQISFADINFGAGATYNSKKSALAYSLMLEYLMPIIPGILKGGLGAQYFSKDNTFDDIKNSAYMPVYLVGRANIPFVPIISSFFITGRYGYTMLLDSSIKDGGVYYGAGLGYNIFGGLYIEGVYTVYHWNKYSRDDNEFVVHLGFGF
ncbi:MAG: hypothetical protein LBQ04_02105 [Endomicrobium sp.]|jgi:hypothetical protein|nr:hypothetical protein [Endomicrobium sp.]